MPLNNQENATIYLALEFRTAEVLMNLNDVRFAFKECPDNFGVKLRSAAVKNYLETGFQIECKSVTFGIADDVEYVTNGCDSSLDRDVVASESFGVA